MLLWAGTADEGMNEQTNEQTNCIGFIHIQMPAVYDRANESENALTHTVIPTVWRGYIDLRYGLTLSLI